MTYGPDDIMGVPWETIVKTYAQKLWRPAVRYTV